MFISELRCVNNTEHDFSRLLYDLEQYITRDAVKRLVENTTRHRPLIDRSSARGQAK